jgi:Domain of unknown function (DUF5615)
MKFKVDENLPLELAVSLREAGHDALTVLDQGLGAAGAYVAPYDARANTPCFGGQSLRRGRESNPRKSFPFARLASGYHRPLGHLSGSRI